MDIREFYNELKEELESNQDGFFVITPSRDKETLDQEYQKFNAQNDEQKKKADIRSFALYGMNNYDHYHILLSKVKKGTEVDNDDDLSYNKDDEEVVKEEHDPVNIAKEFGCGSYKELQEKIDSAVEFNTHTLGRVIIYPTQDANELESLYMKYMALGIDKKASSDNKAQELFGKTNREIYSFIKDNIIKPKQDDTEGTYTKDGENVETDNSEPSLFSNDLPILTPDELVNKVDENYSCFNDTDAESIKAWRESYTLLGHGIKEPGYNKKNLERINILRKAIYENNNDAIIQCGWIPGIEFNSENRVKASKLVRDRMDAINYGIINYNDYFIEEANDDISFSNSFNDVKTIFKSLDKSDKGQLSSGDYENSSYTIYRNVLKYKGEPKAFVEIFNDPDYPKDTAFVVVASTKDSRGKGYVQKLLAIAINSVRSKGISKLIWESSKQNHGSIALAKKFKFTKTSENDEDYEYTLDLKNNKNIPVINESFEIKTTNTDKKKAVSIILVSGNTVFGKIIKKVQNTNFSHAAISLDDDIKRIYSFNKINNVNGLSYESINQYIKEGVDRVGIYTFLVSKEVYAKLEKVLDNFNLYRNKTKYSMLNILTLPLNIDLDLNMKMICSEFVDKLLKLVDIDLTNKKSSLVAPRDFANSMSINSKIVELFNDHPSKFNASKVKAKIQKLKRSNLPIYEFVEYNDEVITEAKSFPIQFDSDGNLIIKNLKKIDFEQEYANSHRLLMEYDKSNSYEPMKFELAKMQFLITLLEKKIYKQGKDKSVSELKVRARLLNDFKKYLKIVTDHDKSFNFTEYYERSKFNDALIQIDKNTLKFGWKALKYVMTENNYTKIEE